ncbi:hypothetical protein BU23DRAFT_75998 [Bimuria novae-zelandiae CBS 107.79]|uniref:Uncharacterized protein n=1 Tax=Bimuria novae-zelandiae CBS 107.79 TaxID=1447943 RepID=A0A6A5VDF8_9PLEO|nr:hypothetical protein BU23DRAFT_75998 [Bimuria novae-zelandiae CBS 107.79]
MPFSILPTELRQMVIAEVITTPFPPPSAPSEVRSENWLYPHEENMRRHSHAHMGEIECNPAIAFNTQGPWGNQHLPLLLVNKSFRADTENVLGRIGRRIPPILDVMLERNGDFKATWLLVPPSTAPETEHLNINIRTLGCMKIFGAEGSRNVPFKRNANVSIDRLLQRITSIGLSPYAKDREVHGTEIRKLRITVVVPEDMKDEEGERAPLATRLSEYLSLGHFGDLSQKIDAIEIFVDDCRAYAFSNEKGYFKLEWSHK